MFRRKKNKKIKCMRCGKKIEKKFDFCPHCGYSSKQKEGAGEGRGEGMEGIKDFQKEFEKAMKMPFFVKFPFRQLVKQLEKQIDAQMKSFDKSIDKDKIKIDERNLRRVPISGISISISGGGKEPVVRFREIGKGGKIGKMRIMTPGSGSGFQGIGENVEENKESKENKDSIIGKMTKSKAAKFAKLPKAEPHTKVRRLTDRIVYEIDLPGIKSIKDIILRKLENSIEIKAYAKDKAYFKLIPISLPIRRYKVENEKLILELVP